MLCDTTQYLNTDSYQMCDITPVKIIDFCNALKMFLKVIHYHQPGLDPTNKNTPKIFQNSCQILRLLKLQTNNSDCSHMKQLKEHF